jgi:hypothetical protein
MQRHLCESRGTEERYFYIPNRRRWHLIVKMEEIRGQILGGAKREMRKDSKRGRI